MRYEDWPERLHKYLTGEHQFDWATHNCALFAAGAVKTITGNDFAAPYLGPKTRAGMIRKLKKAGGLDAAITAALGDPIPLLTARRGDIILMPVFVDNGGRRMEAAGVCIGAKVAMLTENGITMYPLADGLKAWRVE